jgi:hypothetical protein
VDYLCRSARVSRLEHISNEEIGKMMDAEESALRGYRKEDLIGLDMYSEREMKGGRNKCTSGNRQGNEHGEDRKFLARRNGNGEEE